MFPKNFNEAIKTGFLPYILEANGRDDLCSTRQAKINGIIKDFKYIVNQGEHPNDYISEVLAKHGLSEQSLTKAESERINREVNGTY